VIRNQCDIPSRDRQGAEPFGCAEDRSLTVAARIGGAALRGFTLVEMLVSLAVVSLALTVIGVVFSVTTRTTRQAAAYSEANNRVRQFVEQIEEDLRYCEPSQSLLVLVGRTQAAALTPQKLASGEYYRVLVGDPNELKLGNYDPRFNPNLDPRGPNGRSEYSNPRADILMFFSNRPAVSYAPHPAAMSPLSFAYACARGARFSPIQVVYGHAALDEPVFNAASGRYEWPETGRERHIEQTVDGRNVESSLSILPAVQWHLSRRQVIIQSFGTVPVPDHEHDDQFSRAATEGLARCEPYLDGGFMPGDAAYLNLPFLLSMFGPDYFDVTPPPHGNDTDAPFHSPYEFPPFDNPTLGRWQAWNVHSINTLLYATFQQFPRIPRFHHVATVIENPPVELQANMGVHLLSGCAWFQVEFLMPEDPRNSLEYTGDPNNPNNPDVSKRYDVPRWTQVNADPKQGSTTYVFVPDTQENREAISSQVNPATGRPPGGTRLADDFAWLVPPDAGGQNNVSNRIVRMWPYAIRVTVRVFDPNGRLEQPLVRSVVHRFD